MSMQETKTIIFCNSSTFHEPFFVASVWELGEKKAGQKKSTVSGQSGKETKGKTPQTPLFITFDKKSMTDGFFFAHGPSGIWHFYPDHSSQAQSGQNKGLNSHHHNLRASEDLRSPQPRALLALLATKNKVFQKSQEWFQVFKAVAERKGTVLGPRPLSGATELAVVASLELTNKES